MRYLYLCEGCSRHISAIFELAQPAPAVVCANCGASAGRVFTMPQLVTRPTRFLEENRWWWTKPGAVNSTADKLAMDRADAKHRQEQEREWSETKKLSDRD